VVYLAAAIHGARDLGDIRRVAGWELSAASRHSEDSWVARRQYSASDEAGSGRLRSNGGRARDHWLFARNSISLRRLGGYIVFCVLQQIALNSLLHNRMLSLVQNEWVAAGLTGAIFAACHWPNPVLVPLTFVGGAAMAWMFGRVRNIIPLAIGQALLGVLVGWAFPMTWHHHMRVGPGYYEWRR
jgi:hypothetical protein